MSVLGLGGQRCDVQERETPEGQLAGKLEILKLCVEEGGALDLAWQPLAALLLLDRPPGGMKVAHMASGL